MCRSERELKMCSRERIAVWVLAEEQNLKAASMFWPSTDAEIFGIRPSYWKDYDGRFPNEQRVAQVRDWLKLPEVQRPHFITVYFGDADAAAHKFGPESTETAEAVQRVTSWSAI